MSFFSDWRRVGSTSRRPDGRDGQGLRQSGAPSARIVGDVDTH